MTYAEMFNKILRARKLESIVNAVCDYEMAVMSAKGEEDVFAGILIKELEKKVNSPFHKMLLDYIKDTNDEFELSDELFEFRKTVDLFDTKGYKNDVQVREQDFIDALNKAEKVCLLKSILESRYVIEVIETGGVPLSDYLTVVAHKKKLYILLPKVRSEEEITPNLEKILGYCIYKFCVQHYDFETISKITNPFITPRNGFEEQFRKLAVKRVHNKLNDIKEEIPEHHIIYGKDIFEGIKIEEERNKHK